jgi:hypothetical protein
MNWVLARPERGDRQQWAASKATRARVAVVATITPGYESSPTTSPQPPGPTWLKSLTLAQSPEAESLVAAAALPSNSRTWLVLAPGPAPPSAFSKRERRRPPWHFTQPPCQLLFCGSSGANRVPTRQAGAGSSPAWLGLARMKCHFMHAALRSHYCMSVWPQQAAWRCAWRERANNTLTWQRASHLGKAIMGCGGWQQGLGVHHCDTSSRVAGLLHACIHHSLVSALSLTRRHHGTFAGQSRMVRRLPWMRVCSIERPRKAGRQAGRQVDRQAGRQAGRQACRQAAQAGRQGGRPAGRWAGG